MSLQSRCQMLAGHFAEEAQDSAFALANNVLEELEQLQNPSAPIHTVNDYRYPQNVRGEYIYCAVTELLTREGIGFLNSSVLESVIYHLRVAGLDSSAPQTISFQAPPVCETRFNSGTVQIFRTTKGVFLIENKKEGFTVFRKVS